MAGDSGGDGLGVAASRRLSLAALAAGAALVAGSATWGLLIGRGVLDLYTPPLFASFDPVVAPSAIICLVVGGVVVWRGREVASSWRWSRLLAASIVVCAAWGIALAVVGGPPGIDGGLRWPFDHLAIVDRVSGPGAFLDGFAEGFATYPVHVRGHPPGLMPVLWWMDRIGLGGPLAMSGLVIAAGASIPAAAAVTARQAASEVVARRAMPYLVVAPAAVWLVSSADALIAAVGAWGIALVVVAVRSSRGRAIAAVGGALLGYAIFLSYGMVLLALVPLAIAALARRLEPILLAALGASGVVLAFTALGFWWFDGLVLTRQAYAASVASSRPYAYFLVANLAAFSVMVGPACVAGIGALRDRSLWVVVGAGLAIVALADLSGLSKGEVERIWLPFWPWVGLAAAGLAADRGRWWLGAHAGTAVLVEVMLVTRW